MTLVLDQISRVVGGETHLQDISLALEPASLNVLFGPTLAGKTSLMRLMAGLDRPSGGRVVWQGRDVTGQSVRTRDVAMVYQQFVNYPSFTVYDNIASPLKLAGLPKAEIDRKVREAAAIMHIDGLLGRLPAELSGGQQQRTAIARALCMEPRALLLDEPTSALDPELQQEVVRVIKDLAAEHRTMLLVTHDMRLAADVSDHVVFLHQGLIEEQGPPSQLFGAPRSDRLRQFLSASMAG